MGNEITSHKEGGLEPLDVDEPPQRRVLRAAREGGKEGGKEGGREGGKEGAIIGGIIGGILGGIIGAVFGALLVGFGLLMHHG